VLATVRFSMLTVVSAMPEPATAMVSSTWIWEIPGDPKLVALREASTHLGVESTWHGVREVVASGRSAELLRALSSG
jgi:hypothetical protein